MNGKIILGAIIIGGIVFFIFFQKNKSKEVQFFDQKPQFSWERVKEKIPWAPRDSHEVLVFKNKLWLMGGLNGNGFVEGPGLVRYGEAPHFSDIWVSQDGKNWTLITKEAPWGKRRSMQAVVFKDKIWLIGGWKPQKGPQNDIWNSKDGINWNLVNSNPPFSPREGHQLVVFKNKLYLLGGVNYEKREVKNDVWVSQDGIEWFELLKEAPWEPRWDHAVFVFQNKLWLIGGMDLKDNIFGDVWVSENGKDWFLVTKNPPWPKRQGHGVVVFKGKIWLVGRFNDKTQGGGKNDLWYSQDGINWQKAKNPPWQGREDHKVLVFQDKIWVLGGMTVDWVWKNDIWYLK